MSTPSSPALRFSIVMTVFETWHLFPRALACVLSQTFADWELLVVSDGPADPSVHHALRSTRRIWYGRRVLVEECERAVGCWGNRGRRRGLELSQGTHVVWINHDNLVQPTYLEAHAENLRNDPVAVSVVGIDLWQGGLFRKRLPERRGLATGAGHGLRAGRVDLLNYALPRELAVMVDAFGPGMEQEYAADWTTLEACLNRAECRFHDAVVGVHF
jgi:glycosyltransferase involved in cell wall biosynthesis